MKKQNKDMHFFVLSLLFIFIISISLLGILKITGSYVAKEISVEEKEIKVVNEKNHKEKKRSLQGDPLIVPASKVETRE
jgi:hypothetical protein